MIEDYKQYQKDAYRIYGWGHPMVKIYRQLEVIVYYLKKGKILELSRDIEEKVKKIIKRTSS